MDSTARLITATLCAVFGASCLVDAGAAGDVCDVRLPGEIDFSAPAHQYVVDDIRLANSASEATALGLDLDGDPNGRPDNALGQVLGTVFSATDTDIDADLRGLIADGRVLHLIEVHAQSLNAAPDVGTRVFVGVDGDDDPTNNFGGAGQFTVDDSVRAGLPLAGRIVDGRLIVDLGDAPLLISLPHVDEPFILELSAARIEATVTPDGIDGVLAGVVGVQQMRDSLLPIIAASLAATVADDCEDGVCEPDSNGELFLGIFDEDGDGAISLEEVEQNSLISFLLHPDVDMFDQDGSLSPRCDGIKDSLSIAVGFSAVPATF